MSKHKFDTVSDLNPGRYDYKIKVRVTKKWRGATRTGEVFKAFNILLIDNMKTRIHAFIPGFCVDNLEDKMTIGKLYTIKNFTVQKYKESDIYRCLRHDKQLIFSKDTQIEETEEKGTSIPYEMFDFYDHAELRTLADQKTYLTYVVGIIKKADFRELKNSQGKLQKQGKLTITDGSSNVKCTFWDELSRFLEENMNQPLETPKWFMTICTTCERETELKNGLMMCTNCPRVVPHPDKKYKLNVAASDNTGVIDIILTDREVRTLIGKRARTLFDEMKNKDNFPQTLKEIGRKDYTVGIRIREINVVDHYQVYWATNIYNGFVKVEDDNIPDTSTSQPTSSTYQVQGLSYCNFNST